MSYSVRALFSISLLFLVFTGLSWAQKTQPTPLPQPIPDFSRAPDPTLMTRVRYHEYDKTPLTFTTTTQYVLVPVVVLDKNGKPVAGLTKEAFQLLENGKPQKIASVEEFTPTAVPLAKPLPGNTNEFTNQAAMQDRSPRRLVIIALDTVNTPFLDQASGKHQIISYLSDRVEPGNLYQLVAIDNNGLRVLHDYTQDPAVLIAALKAARSRFTAKDKLDTAQLSNFAAKASTTSGTMTPGATDLGRTTNVYVLDPRVDFEEWLMAQQSRSEQLFAQNAEASAAGSTLTALQQIAERVSGVPGRKSLVWITGSFPFSINPGTAAVNEAVSFGVYQHVMQELSNQMISVYPVDARGLLPANADASMHLLRSQNAFPATLISDESNRQRDVLDTMRAFADMTGGRAFVNTNDTSGAIHNAAQDGAQYYMLSYPVDKSNRRPGWRKITVKVGDYHVRARQGYFLTQNTVDPVTSAKFDIDAALTSPLDYTGLPLRVVLQPPVAAGEKKKITFAMMMPPKVATIDNSDNNHLFVDIAYVVLTSTGDSAAHKGTSYNLNLNPVQLQQIETQGVSYGDTVELSPGSYKLRVVMRDNLNGRIGSVLADLNLK